MKSEVIEPAGSEPKYPCLMKNTRHKGLIVLFTTEYSGTVVNPDPGMYYQVGEYSNDWVWNRFEPFTGKLVLSN